MGVLFDVGPVETALAPLLAYEYPAIDLTPTIRIPDEAGRDTHTRSLQSLLDDISATRDTIELLEEKLGRLKDGLQHRELAVRTALTPVSGLPPEVLREIFLATMAQNTASPTSLTLSHVNLNWRSLSLSTRELWTLIQIPSHSDGSETFKEFALRSGTLPLRLVRLSRRYQGRHKTTPLGINMLPIHAPRIASIELHSNAESEQWISSLESCATTMALEDLVLTQEYFGQPTLHHIRGGMVSTRSLRLSGTSLVVGESYSMVRLETLSISNLLYEEINIVMNAIHSAPLLRKLELRHIRAGDEVWNTNSNGYDDRLASLSIINCSPGLWKLLRHWSMPNLTSLTVVSNAGHREALSYESWANVLSNSINLETIDLTLSGWGAEPTLVGFCQLLSGETSQRHNTFRVLHSLTIRVYDVYSVPGWDVLDVIEMRARPNSGVAWLQYLSISKTLVPAEREDRLREIVGLLTVDYDDSKSQLAMAAAFLASDSATTV